MKLSFLSLCFSALILLSSCTKEEMPPVNSGNSNNYPEQPNVTASGWVSASSMTWSDASANGDSSLHSTLSVHGLTQQIIDNGALLVYVKTASGEAPKLLPAIFENTTNSETEIYSGGTTEANAFHLQYTKLINGNYEVPTIDNSLSFRYIFIDNAPSAYTRIATNNGIEYSLAELKHMSYSEVTTILNIGE